MQLPRGQRPLLPRLLPQDLFCQLLQSLTLLVMYLQMIPKYRSRHSLTMVLVPGRRVLTEPSGMRSRGCT